MTQPVFSDSIFFDDRRVARVHVLVFEFIKDEFDRSKDQLVQSNPLAEVAFEVANEFLSRLRVYARLPQVKPLIFGQDVWQVEFMTDDHVLLPRDDKRLRMMRSGFVNLGVPALKAEVIKTAGEEIGGPEPYVWDGLLLDAYSLWPDIGSSIVMAYAWLETFVAWALDILQAEHRLLPRR